MMDLPKISKETSVEACERALRTAVVRGDVQPGERLPAERDLAAQLGVNRQTLRAALASLRHRGLLQVRQGSGAVVQDYRAVGGPELISDVLRQASSTEELRAHVKELLTVRRSLAELLLVRLMKRPAEAAQVLADALVEFRSRVEADPDPDAVAEADIVMTSKLLSVADSAVLRLCLNPVTSVLAASRQLRQAIYEDPTRSVDGFQGLLAWLQADCPGGPGAILAALAMRDEQTLERLP